MLYAGVPLLEKRFSDRIACWVLVFLIKEEKIHKWDFINFDLMID